MATVINSAIMAVAEGEVSAPPLTCKNHTVHDALCGYSSQAEAQTCSHRHFEECYLMILDCAHMTGEGRYNGIGADNSDIEHDKDCYVQKLYCAHAHSEECEYIQAPPGTPCRHKCALCRLEDAGGPDPMLGSSPGTGQEYREYQTINEETHVNTTDGIAPLRVEIIITDHAGNRRTEPANETLHIGLFAAGFNKAEAIELQTLVWNKEKNAYAPVIINNMAQGDYYIYQLLKKGDEFIRASRPDAEFPYFVSGDDGMLISYKSDGEPSVQNVAIKNTERSAWVNIEANKELQSGSSIDIPDEQTFLLKIRREDRKPIKGDIKEITLALKKAGSLSEWSATDTVLLPAGEYLIYEAETPSGTQGTISIEGSMNGLKMEADSINNSVSFTVDYSHLDARNPPSSTGPLYPSINAKVAITGIDEVIR
jgi:hypothetical protein